MVFDAVHPRADGTAVGHNPRIESQCAARKLTAVCSQLLSASSLRREWNRIIAAREDSDI
jgi:hypothetical protein